MRLIGSVKDEVEAYALFAFLRKEGIESTYEPSTDPDTGDETHTIWVYKEDDIDVASDWLKFYKEHPEDPRFQIKEPTPPPTVSLEPEVEKLEEEGIKVQLPKRAVRPPAFIPVTRFILLICAFFFFWDTVQQVKLYKNISKETKLIVLSELQGFMLYDYPLRFAIAKELLKKNPEFGKEGPKALTPEGVRLYQKMQNTPYWQGIYFLMVGNNKIPTKKGPPFEKISKGELWRLLTPSLMHANLLHILFNMLWAYLLGKQIEMRIGGLRYVALIILTAVVTDTAQYLMSGPLFLGYSGVIAGFAGFIWIRQRIAPWEGYPLPRGTLLFLAIFIGAMALFQVVVFFLQISGISKTTLNLANTAHIIGALFGMLCAKIPLFSKSG